MKKNVLQVWILCSSLKHVTDFYLIKLFEPVEKKEYWSPIEIDIQAQLPIPSQILSIVEEKYGLFFTEPVFIPFKKSYEREIPGKITLDYYVVGIKINNTNQLELIDKANGHFEFKWVAYSDVLNYLYKEYHSIIYYDWFNAIRTNKLP